MGEEEKVFVEQQTKSSDIRSEGINLITKK